jgi:hypothetical protein
MTPSTMKAAKPASKHMSSKILFEEFQKLTTRPQYTQGETSDIAEMTVIGRSCRIEETNEHRLALAEKVLFCASQCLELELGLQRADAEAEKKKVTPPPPASAAGSGGYH